MVKIRLSRTGVRNRPSYRIVVVESRKKRDGAVLETLGIYDPKTEPKTVKIKRERLDYWLKLGAQPSQAVRTLLRNG